MAWRSLCKSLLDVSREVRGKKAEAMQQNNSGNHLVCSEAGSARFHLYENRDKLGAIVDLQFVKDVAQVVFHRARADVQLAGNLFVRHPAGKGTAHVMLTLTQLLPAIGYCCTTESRLTQAQCLPLQTGVDEPCTSVLQCVEIRGRGLAVKIEQPGLLALCILQPEPTW